MQLVYDQLIFSMDLQTFFPDYQELEELHRRIFKKRKFKGYGVGGVWDDIIVWTMDVVKRLNTDPTQKPTDIWIPNFSGNGKLAKRYQELFFKVALKFIYALPQGIMEIFPIMFKPVNAVFLLTYHGNKWHQHELVTHFRIEDFSRPVGTRRK